MFIPKTAHASAINDLGFLLQEPISRLSRQIKSSQGSWKANQPFACNPTCTFPKKFQERGHCKHLHYQAYMYPMSSVQLHTYNPKYFHRYNLRNLNSSPLIFINERSVWTGKRCLDLIHITCKTHFKYKRIAQYHSHRAPIQGYHIVPASKRHTWNIYTAWRKRKVFKVERES